MIRGYVRGYARGVARDAIRVGASSGAPAWSPLSWFSASEQGGIYEADLSTLFQDVAGTVPATTVGQIVKRWNDKSGRGNHVTNAAGNWTLQVDSDGVFCVRSDGTTNFVAATSIAWGSPYVSAVCAVRQNVGTQHTIYGFGSVVSTTQTFEVGFHAGGALAYRRGSGSFGGRGTADAGTVEKRVISYALDLSGSTQATEARFIRFNGVSQALTNYGSADSGSGNFGTQTPALGGGVGGMLRADVYGIIVTSKNSSDAEFDLAEQYYASMISAPIATIDADSPVWLDSASPVTETGYIRTSPFSRAKYQTTAQYVSVTGRSTISSTFNSFDQIGVYVNGSYHSSIDPSADGSFTGLVSLAAGSKTIEFVAGLQSSPSQTSVIGSWFVSAKGSAAMTAVTESPSNRLVIYGDSIAVGGNSTVPVRDGWPVLLRTERGADSTVVEAYGYRSLNLDAADGTKRAAFVAKIQAMNPAVLWLAIGTNDYGLNKWSAASFGTAYAATLDDLHAAMPSLLIYCQTPLLRTSETANGSGSTLGDYRSQISSAVSTRTSYCTLVDGTAILTTGQLSDGVHPTTAGHAAYAAYVAGVLGV